MTLFEVLAFLQENAYPYYALRKHNYEDEWQDGVYRALLHSLSTEDLILVIRKLERENVCPITLLYKARGILKSKYRTQLDDIPTSTLLKWYADKKSKKVGLASRALKTRFPKECAEGQRTILKAFLQGGIKELEWASRYLRRHWIRSMSTWVANRWKTTPNPVLAQVILKHLPEAFVIAEQDRLAEAAGYVHVCARLGKRKDFQIDSNRLSTPDYIYALAKSGSKNVDEKSLETRINEYLDQSEWLSPQELHLLLWALGKLGLTETIIHTKRRIHNLS